MKQNVFFFCSRFAVKIKVFEVGRLHVFELFLSSGAFCPETCVFIRPQLIHIYWSPLTLWRKWTEAAVSQTPAAGLNTPIWVSCSGLTKADGSSLIESESLGAGRMDEPGCNVAYFRYTSEAFLLGAFVICPVAQPTCTLGNAVRPHGP